MIAGETHPCPSPSPPAPAPRALLIGGLDPTGGAGLLLDAFVAARAGLQPALAVTTVTAQDSACWHSAAAVDPALLTEQLHSLAAEGPFSCVKIGALGSAANVTAVAAFLRLIRPYAVVLDPVLASSSGGALAGTGALEAMRAELFSLVCVITPNAKEVRVLAPHARGCAEDAATALAAAHGCSVLVTGDSAAPFVAADVLVTPSGAVSRHTHPYIDEIGDVRGTGCMLSTLLACHLSRGATLGTAVAATHSDLVDVLRHARQVGRGRMQIDLSALIAKRDD